MKLYCGSLVHECFDIVSTFSQINKIAIKAVISDSVYPRKRTFLNGCHLRKRNKSVYKRMYNQESYGIVQLYNFIVSNYVDPLKLSNQMSTVKCQIMSVVSSTS
jgi:hypothetical protein